MAQRIKADVNKQGWEAAEFPILCETCLGDNPYVRMTKEPHGRACRVCTRPYTVFRWQAGSKGRFKTTEVCQTCARVKNVCQTCIFDLQYGLPVQVRDAALGIKESSVPRGDVNREFFTQNAEMKMADGQTYLDYSKLSAAGHEMLRKLSRSAPQYRRNQSHICSFFVKGHCSRGDECPYRHVVPESHEAQLSDKNIRDRFYGAKDPVAEKILSKVLKPSTPTAPEDKTVTTIFVAGITDSTTEAALRDQFYVYGEIKSCQLVYKSHCAFVTFSTREGAEKAMEKLYNNCEVDGIKLKLSWGRQQQVGAAEPARLPPMMGPMNFPSAPVLPGLSPAMPGVMPGMFIPPPPPPPGATDYYYHTVTPDLGANKRGNDATASSSAATPNKRRNAGQTTQT